MYKVMRYLEDFGLGPHVPLSLAHVLKEILRTLSEIMQEKVVLNSDLDGELSRPSEAFLPAPLLSLSIPIVDVPLISAIV